MKTLWDTFSWYHLFPGTFNIHRSHISVKFHFADLAPGRPRGPQARVDIAKISRRIFCESNLIMKNENSARDV